MGNEQQLGCCTGHEQRNDIVTADNAMGTHVAMPKKDENHSQLDASQKGDKATPENIYNSTTTNNKFVNANQIRKTTTYENTLNPSKMVILDQNSKQRFGLDAEVVSVPFNVIMMTLNQNLREAVQKLSNQLYKEYLTEYDAGKHNWKLHGNGFYINYEEGYNLAIITATMFYKGVLAINENNRLVPDIKGTLITVQGKYEGQFRKGKSHGQGIYTDRKTLTVYNGLWENGSLIKGLIQSDTFKFKGALSNRKANGKGAVLFKSTRTTYKGSFLDSLYHSESQNAHYESKDYIYTGQFINGMKEGQGTLVEKERPAVNRKEKYHPPDQYIGEWIEDYYVTKRSEKNKAAEGSAHRDRPQNAQKNEGNSESHFDAFAKPNNQDKLKMKMDDVPEVIVEQQMMSEL